MRHYTPAMDEPQPKASIRQALADARAEAAPLAVLVYAAIALTLADYFFLPGKFSQLFPDLMQQYAPGIYYGTWAQVPRGTTAPWWGVLAPWVWWTGGMMLVWVALPACLARLMGLKLADLGLGTRGVPAKLPIYAGLYAAVLVAVFWGSTHESFLRTYPFLKPAWCEHWTWAVLLSFWAVYALQFFCVEFFFRGYLLFALEKRFGTGAIAFMIVPYCMIHFHKPLPEALGAIVAGVVLGWLALRTRSIWGGWLLHVAVAVSMDSLSLLKGDIGLPQAWWP